MLAFVLPPTTPAPGLRAEPGCKCSLVRSRRIWARRTREQTAAVGECHASAVDGGRTVFGAIAFHQQFDTRRKIALSQSTPQEGIRRAELNGPVRHLARIVFYVEINPSV